MSKVPGVLRRRTGSKRPDMAELRAALVDSRAEVMLGQVFEPNGPDSHYQVIQGRIYIEVETIPQRLDLTCSMATVGGGNGLGFWDIPRVGAEVIVVVPSKEIDFVPSVIAVLDAKNAPEGVGTDKAILNTDVSLHVRAPEIKLGSSAAFEQIVLGTSYRARENAMLDGLKAALQAMQAASFGPLASLKPGLIAAIAAINAFRTGSTQNNDDLSKVVKAI